MDQSTDSTWSKLGCQQKDCGSVSFVNHNLSIPSVFFINLVLECITGHISMCRANRVDGQDACGDKWVDYMKVLRFLFDFPAFSFVVHTLSGKHISLCRQCVCRVVVSHGLTWGSKYRQRVNTHTWYSSFARRAIQKHTLRPGSIW